MFDNFHFRKLNKDAFCKYEMTTDKPFETFQQPFTFALTETHVIAQMYR